MISEQVAVLYKNNSSLTLHNISILGPRWKFISKAYKMACFVPLRLLFGSVFSLIT